MTNQEVDIEQLRRALLNRIFLTEIWHGYQRGASLAELAERFRGLAPSLSQVRGVLNYQLRLMCEAGLIEKRERPEPPPRIFYATTERGRMDWLNMHAFGLTSLPESLKVFESKPTRDSGDPDEHDSASE